MQSLVPCPSSKTSCSANYTACLNVLVHEYVCLYWVSCHSSFLSQQLLPVISVPQSCDWLWTASLSPSLAEGVAADSPMIVILYATPVDVLHWLWCMSLSLVKKREPVACPRGAYVLMNSWYNHDFTMWLSSLLALYCCLGSRLCHTYT